MLSALKAIIFSCIIFFIDINLELGVATGILYLLPFYFFRNKSFNFLLALIVLSTLLIGLGYLLSPEGGEHWKIILNRIFSVATLWVLLLAQVFSKRTASLHANKNLLDKIDKTHEQSLLVDNMPEILTSVLSDLVLLTESKIGFYCTILENEGEKIIVNFRKFKILDEKDLTEYQEKLSLLRGTRFNLSEADIMFKVIRQEIPIFSNDIKKDHLSSPLLSEFPTLCTVLGIPIFFGKDLHGVLCLANSNNKYNQNLVQFLKPYLTSSAVALESAFIRLNLNKFPGLFEKNKPITDMDSSSSEKTEVVFSIDSEGIIQFVNSGPENIYGYSSHDLLGQNVQMLMSESSASNFKKYMEELINIKNFNITEIRKIIEGRGKDGQLFPLHLSLLELPTENPKNFICILKSNIGDVKNFSKLDEIQMELERNIMKRSRELLETSYQLTAEIKQRKTKEKTYQQLMELLDITEDFVGIIDESGKFKYINRTGCQLIGIKNEKDLKSINLIDIQPEKTAQKILDHVLPVILDEKIWQGETKFLHRDGYEIPTWQLIASHNSFNDERKIFLTVARDIREYQSLQTLVKGENKKVKNLIDALSPHICIIDDKGNISLVNQAWDKFARENGLGEVSDYGVGLNYLEICDKAGEEGEKIKTGVAGVLKKELNNFIFEYTCDSPEINRWFLAFVNRLENEKDKFVISHFNISNLKATEEKLRKSKNEIHNLYDNLQSAVDEERTKISREIHDELGQSLTAINLNVGWLQNKIPKDNIDVHEELENISYKIEDTITTIRRIANELRPEELELYGLVEAMKLGLNKLCQHSGLKSEFICKKEINIQNSDIQLTLFKVFKEAITNVLRHSQANKVRVTLKLNDEFVNLRISDNGVGIKDKDPFEKSLGLKGMRERVKGLNGQLVIETNSGEGTTLSVSIPISERTDDEKNKN